MSLENVAGRGQRKLREIEREIEREIAREKEREREREREREKERDREREREKALMWPPMPALKGMEESPHPKYPLHHPLVAPQSLGLQVIPVQVICCLPHSWGQEKAHKLGLLMAEMVRVGPPPPLSMPPNPPQPSVGHFLSQEKRCIDGASGQRVDFGRDYMLLLSLIYVLLLHTSPTLSVSVAWRPQSPLQELDAEPREDCARALLRTVLLPSCLRKTVMPSITSCSHTQGEHHHCPLSTTVHTCAAAIRQCSVK